jgi:hypothetical protein
MKRTHLSAAAAALLAVLAAVLIVAGDSSGIPARVVFGQRLTEAGQRAYGVARTHSHQDLGGTETETPPAEAQVSLERSAALLARNQAAAERTTLGPDRPLPLAAREPITQKRLLPRNYSTRNGARPALLVVHDTESPNVAGLQDVSAIAAWFSNPRAQASSNYTTDAEGNSLELVPETAKAWTQAFFNPWAISDELIGHATQTAWPEPQLRAAARIFAAASARWGIPVRLGAVHGCTIVRSGIVDHKMLGACGGGHHDNGHHFPMAAFISLVSQYRTGGYHPRPAAPVPCTTVNAQRALNRSGAHLGVDGIAGPRTRAALKRYQRAHHLRPSGRPDLRTGNLLKLAHCAGHWYVPLPLAAGDFNVPAVFEKKAIWYERVADVGGVRVDRLKSTPGGPIGVVYLDPRDPGATRALRDQLAAQGEAVGIYTDPHWYGVPDPIAYRKLVDSDISRILGAAHDPVMLDFEKLPPAWVQTFLWGRPGEIGYRGRDGQQAGGTRPTRDTAYTNEPFQDGSVVPIGDLVAANLPWFVQLYYGDMRAAEPWWALKQLVLWGYPIEGLKPFYDAAHYPPDWHAQSGGALFTANRLPWLFQ